MSLVDKSAEKNFGLPSLAPPSDSDRFEVTVDVEMAIAMAPQAAVVVYESVFGDPAGCDDLFAALSNDATIHQGSLSWDCGFSGYDPTDVNALKAMAAKGTSFFIPSGDLGATGFPQLNGEPATAVGGTVLGMLGSGVLYQSDLAWRYSNGGVSSMPTFPSWQNGIGNQNGASTTNENIPDLAMPAQNFFVSRERPIVSRSTTRRSTGLTW